MKGDFSRINFDAAKHFSQVLLQQGRVTLDADPNEEGAILLHLIRTLARDLIGPAGGPADNLGFQLALDTTDANHPRVTIGPGRYYVDGILVENEAECDYATQPDFTPASDDPLLQRLASQGGEDFWLYLDVWERHVTWIEDDTIREPALGGPDTCTRAKVVWQVRALARDALLQMLGAERDQAQQQLQDPGLTDDERAALQARVDKLQQDIDGLTQSEGQGGNDCAAGLDALVGLGDARMTARLDPGQQIKDPCAIAPDALYRGAENQLYRVEVHRGSAPGVTPTFKWSRDNGSVATRWLGTEGNDLVVAASRGFTAGCWVELSSDSNDLLGEPGLLVKLAKVDGDRLSVDPASIPASATIALAAAMTHPKVRRWDQAETDDITLDEGAVTLVEASATQANWLTLEDGIQVQFQAGGSYRSGDYWLIPARVATGSIEWPYTVAADGSIEWESQAPDGVQHHYAPVGFVGITANGGLGASSCLCQLISINSCTRLRQLPPIGRSPATKSAPAPTPRARAAAKSK
jgi:hypothetical protein